MINKVIIVGRITKDAEVKKTKNGLSTCRFSVALGKKNGADFINCQAWKKQPIRWDNLFVKVMLLGS